MLALWQSDIKFLLGETTTREKRSLDILGSLWHDISGAPGPRQYDSQQTQIKDLYAVATDVNYEIKHLKGKIDIENKVLKTFIDSAKKNRRVLKNELQEELNITELSVNLDILHARAQSIINLANSENK